MSAADTNWWCSICERHGDHGTYRHCECPPRQPGHGIVIEPRCPVHGPDLELQRKITGR